MESKLLNYLSKGGSKEMMDAYLPKEGGVDKIIRKAFDEVKGPVGV